MIFARVTKENLYRNLSFILIRASRKFTSDSLPIFLCNFQFDLSMRNDEDERRNFSRQSET